MAAAGIEQADAVVEIGPGLGRDPSSIAPGQGFFDAGMDSLRAMELRSRLQRALGEPLPATMLLALLLILSGVAVSQYGALKRMFSRS